MFTVSQIIWNQTKFRLVSNQSKNSVYNLISVMSISLQKENPVGCTGEGKRWKGNMLLDDNKIKMAMKKQNENTVGCTGEGKRWKGNIREG